MSRKYMFRFEFQFPGADSMVSVTQVKACVPSLNALRLGEVRDYGSFKTARSSIGMWLNLPSFVHLGIHEHLEQ